MRELSLFSGAGSGRKNRMTEKTPTPKTAALNAALAEVSEDTVVNAQIRALLVTYAERYGEKDLAHTCYAPEDVEAEFEIPITNPATGRVSRTFVNRGKRDHVLEVEQDGFKKRFAIERKTTTQGMADPASPFWDRLTFDKQASNYLLVGEALGENLHGIIYDVVRRPETSPKKIPAGDGLKKIPKKSKLGFGDQEELSRGTYYGFPLRLEADAAVVFETNALWRNRRSWETSEYPDVSGVLGSGTRAEIELLGSYFGYTIAHAQQTLRNVDENEGRETNYLYSLRVAHAIRQDPDAWMQRRRIVRTEEETKKYAAELWRTTTTIRLAMREDLWLQNDRACQMFNLKPCAYLPLCSGRDLVQSENWTTRKQPHPELDTVQISDLLSLTVSSARCFLQCPMKYWHKYIQRTEPAVSEEAVALSFGRAWHVCQEVYWKTLAVAKLAA